MLDELAATVDLEHPERTPNAHALDSETVHSFFERTVPDPAARDRLALAVQGVWTVVPRDISVLHLLFYIAAAGSVEQLMEAEDCAQDSRFVDGAQATALRIADHLGDRIRLATPVREIAWGDDGATLRTERGDVRADRVIVAVPPAAAARLRVEPPLPVARSRWVAKSPMGDVAKIHVVYETPFWREAGLSGEANIYGDPAVGVVFDNSPRDASRGVLVCFVYADRLHRWSTLDEDARRAEVLGTLETLFGEAAASPREYAEKDWTLDALAGGGYAANPTPGTWVEHAESGWRTPVGPLHWAGTETASRWYGYMDGAIASGLRAAQEVRDQLS